MSNPWKTTRLRFLLITPLSYGATESGISFDKELPRYIRITDIRTDGSLDPENAVSLPRDIAEPYLLNDRDILLARSGATVGKAFLYQTDSSQACFAGYLIRARCDQRRILPEYLSCFLQSANYWRFIKNNALQATIQNVSAEIYKEVPVTHPPINNQKAIIRYLDQQTAKIDRLINLRQRQIALLKEQRAALIQQAVTRGLNPDVPMKDSGLPWLGEIPAHWKVKKLKTLGRIRYGLGQPPRIKENGIPMLRATNVDSGQILTKDLLLVDPDQLPASRDPFLQMGDIIVVRSGALTGDSAIVPPEYYGAVIGYDMVLSVINAEPKFLAAALLTDYVRNQQLRLSMMRAAQPHLNAEELGGAIIVNPPIDEQKMIIEFIEQQNFKIDSLQTAYSRQITLLTEYRAALIHECVTGQRVIPDHFNTGG